MRCDSTMSQQQLDNQPQTGRRRICVIDRCPELSLCDVKDLYIRTPSITVVYLYGHQVAGNSWRMCARWSQFAAAAAFFVQMVDRLAGLRTKIPYMPVCHILRYIKSHTGSHGSTRTRWHCAARERGKQQNGQVSHENSTRNAKICA